MSNSIGDLKNDGLKGNNWPWQYRMLRGLQGIYDEVKKPLTCVEDSIKICDGLGNSLNINANGSLDVNVLSSLPLSVEINQANDSILIYGYDSGGMSNVAVSVDANGFVNTNANVVFPASLDTTIIGPLGSATICDDAVAVTFCADLNTEFLDQGITLDSILTELTTGTLDINVTNATLAVTQSGAWEVALDAATLAALETITVLQGTTPWTVDGTVALDAATLAALETITVNQGTNPWVIGDGGGSITVDGSVTITDGVETLAINPDGSINITDNGGSITVDGTVTANQGTSPWVVSGTVTATPTGTQDVNIVSTVAIPVTDNGGSLTVDGAVTATITGITGPLGERACEEGLSVTLCEDQRSLLTNISTNTTGVARTPGMTRATGAGPLDLVTVVGSNLYSVSVANVGSTDATVLGATIKPNESLNFSADAVNNFFTTFTYDPLTSELLFIYVS